MTIEKLINKINDARYKGYVCGVADGAIDDEIADMLNDIVADDLYEEEYRWYWISTIVYQIGDTFVGLRGVSSLKSETMSTQDCCQNVMASEMVPKSTTTYVDK